MRSSPMATAIAFVLAACAAPFPPNAPQAAQPETITLRTPGDLTQATLDGARIFGPDLEVARFGDSYRGRSRRGLVDLRSQDDTVEGTVGSGRTELHVEERENGFHVRGINGGMLGELDVRSDRIVGQLGGCSYDLHSAPNACDATYSGMRACRGMPEPVELTLPPAVASLDSVDRAAVLAIFLGP